MATTKRKTVTKKRPKAVGGFLGFGIPPEVRQAAVTILRWLGAPPEAGCVAPATCCDDVCANTPAGKVYVVVCDGTGMKALKGTADGQQLAWDNQAGTFVLTNVGGQSTARAKR